MKKKLFYNCLWAVIFLSNGINKLVAQINYGYNQIPYKYYTLATPSVVNTLDDYNAGPYTIPFNFNFYGNNYASFVISTNGCMIFGNDTLASTPSPWQFNQTLPSADFPIKNAILGLFHDMDNTSGAGSISYSIIGAAPYRKMIVMFNDQQHFTQNYCSGIKSSFQMMIYETLNIIDIQIKDKPVCTAWNNGNAISGIVDQTGLNYKVAYNTSQWTTTNQGWRYAPLTTSIGYNYTVCDDSTLDGIGTFNLVVAQNAINSANPSSVAFYTSLTDAQNNTNPIADLNFVNTIANYQVIYSRNDNDVKEVFLRVVDCANDYDLDSAATATEDLNNDTNLANDDTDSDGLPNFIDNDDDGDTVLTEYEYVTTIRAALALLDTDADGTLNYLDNDDDGDGILTKNEDANGNFNPMDDDLNGNNIPDFLDSLLATSEFNSDAKNFTIYPNPTQDIFSVNANNNIEINKLTILNVNGQVVKSFEKNNLNEYNVGDLSKGVYVIKIQTLQGSEIKKLIVE